MTGFDSSGCGRKIPPDELRVLVSVAREELAALDAHGSVLKLIGDPFASDCAVIDEGDGRLRVETTDMVLPMGLDADVWGEIVALHCLSDLYASGAFPTSSLGIFGISQDWLNTGTHVEAYRAACRLLAAEGAPVLGGHTWRAEATSSLGFALTGHARDTELRATDQARVGDLVWLTKPVGASAVLAGVEFGVLDVTARDELVRSMLHSNRTASEVARSAGVRCSTDVSGYGLLGSVWQIAGASRVALHIDGDRVPRFDAAMPSIASGVISTLAEEVFLSLGQRTKWGDRPLEERLLFCDPQVNGGLVFVAAEGAKPLLEATAAKMSQPIWQVGHVVASTVPGVGIS